MESLELNVPAGELEEHLWKVRYMSSADRKPKISKASKEQQQITASEGELKGLLNFRDTILVNQQYKFFLHLKFWTPFWI